MRSRLRALLAGLCLWACTSCDSERAGPEACREILDRLVELELREKGFRDSALQERMKQEYHRTFAPELRRCEELRLPPGALSCIRDARSAEEVSHTCLR